MSEGIDHLPIRRELAVAITPACGDAFYGAMAIWNSVTTDYWADALVLTPDPGLSVENRVDQARTAGAHQIVIVNCLGCVGCEASSVVDGVLDEQTQGLKRKASDRPIVVATTTVPPKTPHLQGFPEVTITDLDLPGLMTEMGIELKSPNRR